MRVENWPIEKLTPYARNPRKNEHAVLKVAASIKEYGWRQPIVVDKDGVVVAGHTRLLAAMHLKQKTVPVHIADELNPIQVKAYRLADNRVAQEAEWDDELLALEIEELQALGLSDLDSLGFEEEELAGLHVPELEETEGLTDPDEVPEPPEEPITKPGDLWLLGAYWECEECGKQFSYEEGKAMKGECNCG
jgi:ParB-like chromosome segregation protein Spo0J